MLILSALTFAATTVAAFGAPVARRPLDPRRVDTLRITVIVDDTAAHRSLIDGTTIGAEEAAHTGALFDQPVATTILDRAGFQRMVSGPARAQQGHRPSIYIVAGDSSFCSQIVQQSVRDMVPVLDVGCPLGASSKTVYSIDSRPDTADKADSTHLELWHSSLERFGAEQLNQRFRRRFNQATDSDAWAGWFAVKIALDLALHAHSAVPSALLAQLADPHAAFDGQKGRPLRFASATHRLIQPLYRVMVVGDSSRVVGEIAP